MAELALVLGLELWHVQVFEWAVGEVHLLDRIVCFQIFGSALVFVIGSCSK